ncbi:MAG: hypothetical protein U0744_13870 [Gemmataceae bacterium]
MPRSSDDAPSRTKSLLYFPYVVFFLFAMILLTGMFGIGLAAQLRIPYYARQADADPNDVAIRCLDQHQAEPFYLIEGYDEATARIAPPLQRETNLKAIRSEKRGEGTFSHVAIMFTEAESFRFETTTPHTMLSAADLRTAREDLARMYRPDDVVVWAKLRSWGESLFLRWWDRTCREKTGSRPVAVEPARGTEDEHLWFAWARVTAGYPDRSEVFRLAERAKQAFPNAVEYDAAMAWAKTYYDRRNVHYRAWLSAEDNQDGERSWFGEAAVPPASDFVYCWILDQHVGLTESSRARAKARWLKHFPGHEGAAIEWGKQVERERRTSSDALPPSSDMVALVCVVERLTGWDDRGMKSRGAAIEVLRSFSSPLGMGSVGTFLQTAISMAYPSDDVFQLLATGDSLGVGTLPEWDIDRSSAGDFATWIAGWFLLVAVFQFMFRCVVLDCLGGRILRLSTHDRFRHYYNSQVRGSWKGLLLGMLVVPLGKWAWEWYSLQPPISLLTPSPFHLLAGTYMGVLFGGFVILLINRLTALILLRLGVDIERNWLDEIVGTALGVALLAYFGNDAVSLATFAAAGVLPEAFKRIWRRFFPTPKVFAPATFTDAAVNAVRDSMRFDPNAARIVRIGVKQTTFGPHYDISLTATADAVRDVIFETKGLTVAINDFQADEMRGLVVDYGTCPPGFLVYHPALPSRGAAPIAANEDGTCEDPAPLLFEEHRVAFWIGLVLALAFFALAATSQAFAEARPPLSCEVRGAKYRITWKHDANQAWAGSGLIFDAGTILDVHASGTIEAAPDSDRRDYYHAVPPKGRDALPHLPHPKEPGLALLGKIHDSVFRIGDRQRFQITGRPAELSLGINDDMPADNTGSWKLEIWVDPPRP